jgi:hypothetical protein
MGPTDYAGIDYSGRGSTVNRDTETGIRYGMISQNSLSSFALGDIYTHGDDLGWEDIKQQAKADLTRAIAEVVRNYGKIGDPNAWANDIVENDVDFDGFDEGGPYRYEFEGYVVQTTDSGDMWVFKSPYYTHAQFCSPCVPGAGNLDCPCPDGPKTYCLASDWFEDGKAPYDVWSVETGEKLSSVEQS